MSYLLANALPDRIAAIASVSGSPGIRDDDGPFPVDLTKAPTTSRTFPVLYFVGTADTEQFAGGTHCSGQRHRRSSFFRHQGSLGCQQWL